MREKVGKSRNTVFFQWFVAQEGGKVGSLKRRVRSQLARWEMKNCTLLWREAHFEVKMCKPPQRRTTFGSWDVEKVHAVVARSTFRSQNVTKHLSGSDHFWKLRCRKSARSCGAKHISKSKCYKTPQGFGPLLEVEMSKKCTQLQARSTFPSQSAQDTPFSDHFWKLRCRKRARSLWREAHFEVQNVKNTRGYGPLLEVQMLEKVHAVVARSTFRSQNVKKTGVRTTLLEVQMSLRVAGARDCAPCQKWAKREGLVTFSTTLPQLHHITPHYAPIHYTTLQLQPHLPLHYYYTTLHYTTTATTQVHSITLHYITLHYITLRYTTLHYTSTTLHYITLHYAPQHYNYNYATTLHYTKLHSTTLNYTTLHYTTLHYTTYHYTTLHDTTLHPTTLQLQLHNYTPLHSTSLNYTTLHYITLHYTDLPLHFTTLHYTTLNDTAPQIDR